MDKYIKLLNLALELIKPNPEGQSRKQDRRDLKAVIKLRRRLYRRMKKGGWTEEEKTRLKEIDDAIFNRTMELGS